MLRNIQQYEQEAGLDIDLPRDVLDKLQIPQEDWQLFRAP